MTLSPPEILHKHNIAYIATKKGKYTTKCPSCGEGYCDVKIGREGVQWYCRDCLQGGGEFFDQRDQPKGQPQRDEPKAVYDYTDEAGKRLYQSLRYEPIGKPKYFRQRIGPEQKKWSIKGARLVPFHLPQLLEAITNDAVIWIVEGEKDVLTLERYGIAATCNAMGAGKWRDEYNQHFIGADIVICGDHDEPGRRHVRQVAGALFPVARCVRILNLKTIWPAIEESDDVSDWFERAPGASADILHEAIGAVIPLTEVPPDEPEPQGNGHDADEQAPSRFTLKRFEDIKLTTGRNYRIKGLLPLSGLAVIWGPPKCGKSFIAFDMAMHIALGREYRGRRVQSGVVVYCALEGGGGFAARVAAWRKCKLGDDERHIPFLLLDVAIDLIADQDELIGAIGAQAQRPAVVFIDTLNRALTGDENSSADMGKLVRAAAAISAVFGCLVVLIHHCGVAGNRPRGHSSLSGADDAQIAVSRDKDGVITVTIDHMKDGPTAAPFACRLDPVELGDDDDGDPITSCIVIPEKLDNSTIAKLTGNTKLAWCNLLEVLKQHGQSEVAGHRAVSVIRWRERFYDAHTGGQDSKQKAFVRATLKLQELHLVIISGELAWLPDNPDNGQTT